MVGVVAPIFLALAAVICWANDLKSWAVGIGLVAIVVGVLSCVGIPSW